MYPDYYKNILVIREDSSVGACASWCVPTSEKITYLSSSDPFPDLDDCIVFLLGFTYETEKMKILLDGSLFTYIFLQSFEREELKTDSSFCIFDPWRNCAQISWDFFHPREKRPWFMDYVGYSEEILGRIHDLKNMNTYKELLEKDANWLSSVFYATQFYKRITDLPEPSIFTGEGYPISFEWANASVYVSWSFLSFSHNDNRNFSMPVTEMDTFVSLILQENLRQR